jgi:primosomal protein N' (replication factor Y)
MNAAALVRPGPAGGAVIVVADAGLRAVQALIRWDPVTHAEQELAERTALGFPPAVRMAALTGPAAAVREVLSAAVLPERADVLGPVPVRDSHVRDSHGRGVAPGEEIAPGEEPVRVLIRVPRSGGLALATALRAAQAVRSARKDAGVVRLQLDPAELI